ncbi:MAG: hypothetical protein SH856_02655 [Flavobacteriales bacterium]|nr:hypothetical protein [Flavobacteriales bacterium]
MDGFIETLDADKKEKLNKEDDFSKSQADSFPFIGQFEPLLNHLNHAHRRIIVGNYKIIHLVFEKKIVITDSFDSRQDPDKMKP